MSNIFTRMSFWTKFQLTVQSVGTFTQLSLIFGDSQLFEKEVTVKVTSDSPITTEVKTETKES